MFEPASLAFACTCSRERTAAMLQALGQDEVHDIVREQGTVSITCEFCGMSHAFDAVDAASLFTEAGPLDSNATRH